MKQFKRVINLKNVTGWRWAGGREEWGRSVIVSTTIKKFKAPPPHKKGNSTLEKWQLRVCVFTRVHAVKRVKARGKRGSLMMKGLSGFKRFGLYPKDVTLHQMPLSTGMT